MVAGPEMGKALATLESEWIEGGFGAARQELLQRAAQLMNRN